MTNGECFNCGCSCDNTACHAKISEQFDCDKDETIQALAELRDNIVLCSPEEKFEMCSSTSLVAKNAIREIQLLRKEVIELREYKFRYESCSK